MILKLFTITNEENYQFRNLSVLTFGPSKLSWIMPKRIYNPHYGNGVNFRCQKSTEFFQKKISLRNINLDFQDPPSLKFHNRTDINTQAQWNKFESNGDKPIGWV